MTGTPPHRLSAAPTSCARASGKAGSALATARNTTPPGAFAEARRRRTSTCPT